MKIVDIKTFKNAINKLDNMAQDEPSKIMINFHQKDEGVSEKMQRFFEVADGGNPSWNV